MLAKRDPKTPVYNKAVKAVKRAKPKWPKQDPDKKETK